MDVDYLGYARAMGQRNPIASGLSEIGQTLDDNQRRQMQQQQLDMQQQGQVRQNRLADMQLNKYAKEEEYQGGLESAMQNPQTSANPASLRQLSAYTPEALALSQGKAPATPESQQQLDLANAPAVPETVTESPAIAGAKYAAGKGRFDDATKMMSVDDMMNKYAAQVLESGGDPVEYHAAKQKLASAKEFAGVVKDFAKTPGLIAQMWPIISKAYPDAAGLDPEDIHATKDGIAIPLTVNGKVIENRYVLYGEDGKGQIVDTTPKKSEETWGKPYAGEIGGKKIMLQESSTGQVRTVAQDTSTTVKVTTGGKASHTEFKDVMALRKEFSALPEVKDYSMIQAQSLRAKKALEESLKNRSNMPVDQTVITTFNKLLDPSSVVRESEYARTPQDLSLLSRIKGKWDKIQSGGAGLDLNERQAILRMITNFSEIADTQYNDQVSQYTELANRNGFNPGDVIRLGHKQGQPAKTQASATPAVPKSGQVVDGYKFRGGNPAEQKNWIKVGR